MPRKTYWQSMSLHTDRDKENCKSWFPGLCDGMTPYKAEVLCDIDTDREKKLRVFMVGADGRHHQLERTRGHANYSVSIKEIPAPAGAH